jgi:hypothetical protein
MARIDDLVDAMSLEEQVSLLSGEDFWSLPTIERLGVAKLRVTDGPNGARGWRLAALRSQQLEHPQGAIPFAFLPPQGAKVLLFSHQEFDSHHLNDRQC